MNNVYLKLREWGSIAMFLMVTGLAIVWLVLGSATISHQNQSILKGMQQQQQRNLASIKTNQSLLVAGTRYTVCLLQRRPEDRTPKFNHRCQRQSGWTKLP